MNYHDFIWDLGGTLLDNYRRPQMRCSDIGLSHQADHDSVYAALKSQHRMQTRTSPYFQFSYGIQEKKEAGLARAGLI